MNFGLLVSFTAHVALLGWALVSFQATKPLKVAEPEPVEVALISADELVRLRQGDRSSKNLETRAAPERQTAPAKQEARREIVRTVPPPAAAPPPPPQEDPIEKKLASLEPIEPKGPTPEEIAAKEAAAARALALRKAAEEKAATEKKAAEEAERKRKADAEKKRHAEAQRKRREAEKRRREQEAARKRKLAEQKQREERERQAQAFDSGRISALLNKIPEAKAPEAGSPDPSSRDDLPTGARAGAPEGRDTQLTASQRSLLGAMMKQAVSRCWNINAGLEGADQVIVELEVRFAPNGRLEGQPKVVNTGRGALFQDAVNSAVRALIQCEPYDLPQQFYKGGWDHMVVTFDPQKMF